MAKNKQFNLQVLNSLDKQFNEKKTVLINGKYEVAVDVKFRKTKLQNVLAELQILARKLKEEGNVDEGNLLNALFYIQQMLIIKNFTSIPFPAEMSPTDYINLFEKFMDNGILEELFQNGFDQNELNKLYDDMGKIINNMQTTIDQIMNIVQELEPSKEDVVQ